MDVYKYLNINIGTVIKNPNMLKLVTDHLKTKKYVSMQFKNHPICEHMFLININITKCVINLFQKTVED